MIESESALIKAWDGYVIEHPKATLYHLSSWKNVISRAYALDCYYVMASRTSGTNIHCITLPLSAQLANEVMEAKQSASLAPTPVGILPLVHLKHFLFGNSLISIPFFDMGGILADDETIERALLSEALRIRQNLNTNRLELRQLQPLSWLAAASDQSLESENGPAVRTSCHKVRMVLDLPDTAESLMQSFKSKLRNQIRKPLKEGLKARIGGAELLDHFYDVFSANMRDLGSPVHSRKLIKAVLAEFPDQAKIAVVFGKGSRALASSLIIGFGDTLQNPWASALREYSALSPNMLLYWSMLEYACNQGFKHFDFGRSSPGEGTYLFKEQWGARPVPLNWYDISPSGRLINSQSGYDKTRFEKAIYYWQRLPVPVTKILGPRIRKYIGL